MLNHLFGAPVTVLADDFFSIVNVRKVIPSVQSDFDLDSRFNDDGAGGTKLNVAVNQRTYAWSNPADSKYIIFEYMISNTGANALSDFFAGIYSNWDIGDVVDNREDYDSGLKMGYAFNVASTPVIYAAIKQLFLRGTPIYMHLIIMDLEVPLIFMMALQKLKNIWL